MAHIRISGECRKNEVNKYVDEGRYTRCRKRDGGKGLGRERREDGEKPCGR